MRHVCVSNLTIISSDNGLAPGQHQAIIRTNSVILLTAPYGTEFSEILIKIKNVIHENAFESVIYKMAVIISAPMGYSP